MKPSDYASEMDGRRFHVTMIYAGMGKSYVWNVLDASLTHICECETEAVANMIAAALEMEADPDASFGREVWAFCKERIGSQPPPYPPEEGIASDDDE